MNIRDLAAALHLAPGTVSKCLSDRYQHENIPDQTVQRVRAYAAEVGYVPNSFAQKIFQRGDSGVIGILILQDNAIHRNLPILSQVLSRLNASSREYLVLSNLSSRLADSFRAFRGMKIRNVIVIGSLSNASAEENSRLYDGLRIYVLDYRFGEDAGSRNFFAFRGGIDRRLLYLQLGRLLKREGFFPFACDWNCFVEDLEAEHLVTPDYVIPVPDWQKEYSFEQGILMCDQVMKCAPRAVLIHHDQIAIGLCNELMRRGVRIPEELAVIGFNNSPYSSQVAVPLTSVELPVPRNAELVLNHLLEGKMLPETMKTAPGIVCRKSTPESLNRELEKLSEIFR